MKKTKIPSVILSVVISLVLIFTSATALLLSVIRDYYTSSQFDAQVENTDLAGLKFIYNGEKITLEDYVKEFVNTNVDDFILDKAGQYYSELWFPFADALTDYTVDKAFSSEYVNTLVKDEFREIVDYFLYSDADEASDRLKNNVSLENNYHLDPENTSNYEEKIKAQVKLAVLQYIEKEWDVSCDEIIVILAENTISALKTASIISAIALIVLNIKTIVSVLLYLGVVLFGAGGVVSYVLSSFEEYFDGMTDIITYELLKPVSEVLLPYTEKLFISGAVCILAFIVMTLLISKKRKSNN